MASVSAIESEQGGQHAVSGEFKHRAVAVDWAGYRRTSNPGDTVKAAVISWRQTCRTSAVGTVEGKQSRQLSCRCQLKNRAIIVETIGNVIARGDDDRYAELYLAERPDAGNVIRGSGGMRKVLWAGSGRGKRGGLRVIYYLVGRQRPHLDVARVSEERAGRLVRRSNKTASEGIGNLKLMKKKLFKELLQSVTEAAAIERDVAKPSRTFRVRSANDVVRVRAKLGLPQTKFARLLGISEDTLQNWEQGRRKPAGPAKVLLKIAAKYPKIVLESAV